MVRVREFWGKYRWAALILAVGLTLMMLPDGKNSALEASPPTEAVTEESLEQKLEVILSQLEGAGHVKVLLTVSAGAEYHYQTDLDEEEDQASIGRREETVIVTGADRSQTGLLRRTDPPRYLGAVVLCQGAGSASVRLAVVEAVGTATGLTSDKISVCKMK